MAAALHVQSKTVLSGSDVFGECAWNERKKQVLIHVKGRGLALYDVGKRCAERTRFLQIEDDVHTIYLLERKHVYVVLSAKNKACSILRIYSESMEMLAETIAYQDYELRSCTKRGEEIVTVAENEKSSYIRTWNVRYCPMSEQKYKIAVRLSLRIRDEIVTCLCVDERRDELVGILASGKVCVWNCMTGSLHRCHQKSLVRNSHVDKIVHTSSLGFVMRCSEGLEIWSRDFKNCTLLNATRLCAMTTLDDDTVNVLTVRSNGCVELWDVVSREQMTLLRFPQSERATSAVIRMIRNKSRALVCVGNQMFVVGVSNLKFYAMTRRANAKL